MPRVEREMVINRPVEEVFDFMADGRNEPHYNPHMLRAEQTSAGPIGRGSLEVELLPLEGELACLAVGSYVHQGTGREVALGRPRRSDEPAAPRGRLVEDEPLRRTGFWRCD